MNLPPRVLINGQRQTGLNAWDRGCMYGDGVFRTLRVQDGAPLWWDDQLRKLCSDAERLAIPCPPKARWEADVGDLLDGSSGDCALKLVLTRGPGQRGYAPPAAVEATRLVMTTPLPTHLERVCTDGARLRVCRLRLAEQPRLAGVKHLNRLENVLARMEWDDAQVHEGLLLDAAGRVVCAVSSNVFIYRAGELLTPALHRCGVAGVARARLMRGAGRLKLPVRETDIGLDDLMDAEEVMLTNSLIKVWRVARLDDRAWGKAVVSDALRALLDD